MVDIRDMQPDKLSDIYISTVSVRDFCLMNQEKVSQPQILLRSSNYEVEQAYSRASGIKDRVDSFGQSSSDLMKEKNAAANATTRRYFDLEEEDGMAMVDQAPEEIDDFFLRFTLGSIQIRNFEV